MKTGEGGEVVNLAEWLSLKGDSSSEEGDEVAELAELICQELEAEDDGEEEGDEVVYLVPQRSRKAVEQLAREGLNLLYRLAHIILNCNQGKSPLSYDDLVSIGYIALDRAAERFDETKMITFTTYAFRWVSGAMNRAISKERKLIAMTEAGYRCLALLEDGADVLYDSEEQHLQRFDEYCDALLAAMYCGLIGQASTNSAAARELGFTDPRALELLPTAVASLPDDQRNIINHHWIERKSLRVLSGMLGISISTMKIRHQSAMDTLAVRLKKLLAKYLLC